MTERDGASFRRECAWCSEPAPADAKQCPSCGAALAQRSSIGGLVIPGVTSVDPALKAFADQPLHIPKASPSQGVAGGAVLAAAAGGPIGLAALGGLAAIAAAEYIGANRGGGSTPQDLAAVGTPSGAVLQALERLERQGQDPEAGDPAPRQSGEPGDPDGGASPTGRSR